MPFSSIDDFYQAYKISPNEDLSYRQYEGAMALADGLQCEVERMREEIGQLLRVLAYALEKTGPIFVPSDISFHEQGVTITSEPSPSSLGVTYSVHKNP